ncbi:hypothetical protein Q4I28_007197 [Leishmania naiffi]|uniref:Protein shisa-5 n=1 Tax=Leishmania naiffi TaxID=5678 RepID=A0AAW3BBT2_9TRYP
MSAFESVLSAIASAHNHSYYHIRSDSATFALCSYVFPTGYCYRRPPGAIFCGNTCKIIAGSIFAGLALLFLVVVVVYYFCFHKTTQQPSSEATHITNTNQPGPSQPVPLPQQPMFGDSGNVSTTVYNGTPVPMLPAYPGNNIEPLGYVPSPYAVAPIGYGYQPQPLQPVYPLATTQATDGVYGGGAVYHPRVLAAEDTPAAFAVSGNDYPRPEKGAS